MRGRISGVGEGCLKRRFLSNTEMEGAWTSGLSPGSRFSRARVFARASAPLFSSRDLPLVQARAKHSGTRNQTRPCRERAGLDFRRTKKDDACERLDGDLDSRCVAQRRRFAAEGATRYLGRQREPRRACKFRELRPPGASRGISKR